MIANKVIVALSHRRAGRHAVKTCGAQEKASAGLAWGGVVFTRFSGCAAFLAAKL